MANKYIFCFDGTCNDPEDSEDFFEDSSISNVLKIHAFLGGSLNPLNAASSQTPGQRSFYYSGIGTRGNWLQQKLNAMFAPPDGDMEDILDQAGDDLRSVDCQDDDEIYIFGFSRGAAIARMFAAELEHDVTFLGVFDTVAATRGSLDLNPETKPASDVVFEDGTLGAHIKQAVHLVSLDEKRIAFQPTLMNKREGVEEIWFPGVHSDVGGGYWFDGLSDIALEFMLARVRDRLKVLDLEEINYSSLALKRGKDAICEDDLNVKSLTAGILHEQKRSGVRAKTLAPRSVRVNENDVPSKTDIPIVHHSVRDRFNKVTGYRPYALRNVAYRLMDADGNVEADSRNGVHELA